MFKSGLMRIGDAEYTLYLIQMKGFYRTDIVTKDAEFQFDTGSVLYSCYRRSHKKQIGNPLLYLKYAKTIACLKKIQAPTAREEKWVGDAYIQKMRKGNMFQYSLIEWQNGDLYSEQYIHDDIAIELWVINKDFNIMLIPLNSHQYQHTGAYVNKRKCKG